MISVIKKLSKTSPQHFLITINKSFVRPDLDCGYALSENPNNECLCQKTESLQYKATLAITGTIRGTFTWNFLLNEAYFLEDGLKNCLIRIRKTGLPENMFNISQSIIHSNHPLTEDAAIFDCRIDVSKYSLFPINHNRIKQTWHAKEKIRIFPVFKKIFTKGYSTYS